MRRSVARKQKMIPDPIYNSELVAKFVNHVMKKGKKSLAERIVYQALEKLERDVKKRVELLKRAVDNVSPPVEVKPRRVGGSTYQVPVEVKANRRETMGIRLIVTYGRKRGEKSMGEGLGSEMLDALHNRGGAFKRCEEYHKVAEANKAFAHYRW